MKASEHIIEVGESDFQYQVLAFSNQTPVVVDFWAEWCAPCKLLGPTLEKLAVEGAGAFRLAKVDVDANPSLAMQFDVRGIPAVKAIRGGQVIAEFTGARSEADVRDFLLALAPNPGSLTLDKGSSLLTKGEWNGAGKAFSEVLATSPDDAQALLGLAKSQLAQGNAFQALPILRAFPASKEYSSAEQLVPLAQAMADADAGSSQDESDNLHNAYQHTLRLVSLGNIPSAIDGMLDILRQDKGYRNGLARKLIVGMLHLLGEENSQTKAYRSELSSILF